MIIFRPGVVPEEKQGFCHTDGFFLWGIEQARGTDYLIGID